MLSPHSSSQVPEWSSKYIRYEHLAKILSSLPMREKEQRDIEKSITLELENAAASDSQQRNRSPPRSGSEAFGRVTIEVQSDFSSQKEYGNSAFVVIFVTSCTCIIMRRTSTSCLWQALTRGLPLSTKKSPIVQEPSACIRTRSCTFLQSKTVTSTGQGIQRCLHQDAAAAIVPQGAAMLHLFYCRFWVIMQRLTRFRLKTSTCSEKRSTA